VVEFSGRKVIKDEIEAYLADLELTRRPARTVQSKRKYLGDFVGLIGKKFTDEYRREDVLKYKNKLQDTRPESPVRCALMIDEKGWPIPISALHVECPKLGTYS
jgi:hypothetical protein